MLEQAERAASTAVASRARIGIGTDLQQDLAVEGATIQVQMQTQMRTTLAMRVRTSSSVSQLPDTLQ